jgi:hypothetical protein
MDGLTPYGDNVILGGVLHNTLVSVVANMDFWDVNNQYVLHIGQTDHKVVIGSSLSSVDINTEAYGNFSIGNSSTNYNLTLNGNNITPNYWTTDSTYPTLIRPIPAISGLILPQAIVMGSGFFVGDVINGNLTLQVDPNYGTVYIGTPNFPAAVSILGEVNIGNSGTNYNFKLNGNPILPEVVNFGRMWDFSYSGIMSVLNGASAGIGSAAGATGDIGTSANYLITVHKPGHLLRNRNWSIWKFIFQ